MSAAWDASAPGVLVLPSGRRVRGRGLRHPLSDGPEPDLGIYLLGRHPTEYPWESRWVKWRDFWVPNSPKQAASTLAEAWKRAATERVEVACGGGVGRTGTALAALAVLDGVPALDAVAYVRARYHLNAVETPWQRRFVERFSTLRQE